MSGMVIELLKKLHVFGFLCFTYVPQRKRDKFDKKKWKMKDMWVKDF